MGIDNEIDDGLTDEERAALNEPDDEEGAADGGDNNDNLGGEDNAAQNDSAGDDGGAAGEDDAAAAADDAGAGGDAETGEAAAGQPEGTATESAPILIVQPPADAEAKLADIAKSKEELMSKFDDGDITAKEYQQQLDTLNKQERDIEFDLREAKLAEKMESQRQANEWQSTVSQFISENPRYNAKTSPRMYQLLDLEVRRVATSDEFKTRTDSAAGREILLKAHENIAKDLGFEAAPKQKDTTPKPKGKSQELPPSLHQVPAADVSETNGGKYAVLDRLASTDPIGYEEALMKLPESERNAYLASA